MKITTGDIWNSVTAIREKAPLIHNITNYVVMNSTANALLALGASPVMAHAWGEVEQMVDLSSALVINIGTLSEHWITAMFRAAKRATERKVPIILDPVGVGATDYRTRTGRELLQSFPPAIIRGNASEIISLARKKSTTKGVDSTDRSESALEAARTLRDRYGAVVCVSGAEDYILGAAETAVVRNGHPMMTRVTGLGCTATALCGAFAAVERDAASAAVQAMVLTGIAGEMAQEKAAGPASLQMHFIDTLYSITGSDIECRFKAELCTP